MNDTYHGSTVTELQQEGPIRRILSIANQVSLFAHTGEVRLTADVLDLSGWMSLRPNDIAAVDQEFVPEYGRFTAGGARGGFPSLGFVGSLGKPLILDLVDGSRLVLVIGFQRISGTTRNSEWFPALSRFATP